MRELEKSMFRIYGIILIIVAVICEVISLKSNYELNIRNIEISIINLLTIYMGISFIRNA